MKYVQLVEDYHRAKVYAIAMVGCYGSGQIVVIFRPFFSDTNISRSHELLGFSIQLHGNDIIR